MKDGWEIKTLGEIGKVSMCKRILKKQTSASGDIPFYKIGTFGKTPNAFIDREIYHEYKEKYSYPNKGDILISASGTIGRRVVYDGKPAYFQDSNIVWIENNQEQVSNDYLYRFYGACDWNPSKGATISRLYNDDLRRIKIPIPPLSEQEEIVEVLDTAFAAIDQAKANIEQNIANAKELFQSKLNQIFSQEGEGWRMAKVSDVADHRLGKMLDKRKNTGTPKTYLRNKNVRWFECDLDDLLEMPFEDCEYEKYTVHKGDVIICEGGYPGRAAIWTSDQPIYFQKAIHGVRFNEPSLNKWFVYYLWNMDYQNALKDYFTGAGIQHFTGQSLAKFPLPIGPVKAIREQVIQLDKLHVKTEAIVASYQTKLTSLEELKKSILQKAFAGELTKGH